MIGGLVLAAGGASRFGGGKQLAELRGRPLLEHAVDAMRSVPAIERIVVVLGAGADEISRRVDLGGVEALVCEGWEEGIAASLRAGVEALADCEAIVITLGDQPFITPQVIAAIVDFVPTPAPGARATYEGRPGHPVMIKRALYEDVLELRGDAGARDLLAAAGAREFEAAQLCSPADVDTREDLERLGSR